MGKFSTDTVTISGHVYDSDSIPLSCSFSLAIKRLSSDGTSQYYNDISINSDTLGFFSVRRPLADGNYYMLVKDASWDSLKAEPIWINGEKLFDDPTTIPVSGDLTGLSLYLNIGGEMYITAKDIESDSVTGNLHLYCLDEAGYEISSGYEYISYGSDSVFEIKIDGLPEGNYYLMTSYSSGEYPPNYYYPGTFDFNSAEKINITAGSKKEITFNVIKKDGSSSNFNYGYLVVEANAPSGEKVTDLNVSARFKNNVSRGGQFLLVVYLQWKFPLMSLLYFGEIVGIMMIKLYFGVKLIIHQPVTPYQLQRFPLQ